MTLRTRGSSREVTFRFYEIAQPAMMIVNEATPTITAAMAGAYVKLQPTIRASERARLDAKVLRDQLVIYGSARAVVFAPIVVPDGVAKKSESKPTSTSPEQRIKAMLSAMKASKKTLAVALEEAMQSLGEAGL